MRYSYFLGDRPDKGRHFAGKRDDHLLDVFAAGHQAAVALAEAHRGFPADILERFGHFCQPELAVATPLGGVAIGPRACDEDPPGRGVARCGEAPLPPSLPPGGCTRDQPQLAHELARRGKAREIPPLGNQSDGGEELYAAQGLEGFDDRIPAPALHQRLQFGFPALEPVGLLGHRPDILRKDALLGRRRADHVGSPPQLRRRPMRPPLIPNVLAEQQGFEPHLGRLEVLEPLLPGSNHIPDCFLLDARHVHRPEVARAQ